MQRWLCTFVLKSIELFMIIVHISEPVHVIQSIKNIVCRLCTTKLCHVLIMDTSQICHKFTELALFQTYSGILQLVYRVCIT